MGKRGPRKTSTKLQLLRGNPGRRPLNKNEPAPAPLSGDNPPEWLCEEAGKWWLYYGPRLKRRGLLTELDEEKFGTICRLKVRVEELHLDVAEHGVSFTTKTAGYEQVRPAAARLDAALDRLMRLWSEFGGSPSSRTGISVKPPETGPKSFIDQKLGGRLDAATRYAARRFHAWLRVRISVPAGI